MRGGPGRAPGGETHTHHRVVPIETCDAEAGAGFGHRRTPGCLCVGTRSWIRRDGQRPAGAVRSLLENTTWWYGFDEGLIIEA